MYCILYFTCFTLRHSQQYNDYQGERGFHFREDKEVKGVKYMATGTRLMFEFIIKDLSCPHLYLYHPSQLQRCTILKIVMGRQFHNFPWCYRKCHLYQNILFMSKRNYLAVLQDNYFQFPFSHTNSLQFPAELVYYLPSSFNFSLF